MVLTLHDLDIISYLEGIPRILEPQYTVWVRGTGTPAEIFAWHVTRFVGDTERRVVTDKPTTKGNLIILALEGYAEVPSLQGYVNTSAFEVPKELCDTSYAPKLFEESIAMEVLHTLVKSHLTGEQPSLTEHNMLKVFDSVYVSNRRKGT